MSDNDLAVRVVFCCSILGVAIIFLIGCIVIREAELADAHCMRALELTCTQPQSMACQTALRCLADLDTRRH